MSRTHRRKRKNNKKTDSVMPLSLTAGLFLGFGLGALLSNIWTLTLIGALAGAGIGYLFDRQKR
jgi:F0F1-type ATP synthase assembly protein I